MAHFVLQLSILERPWLLQQTLQESPLQFFPPSCTAGWAQVSAGSPHLPQCQGVCQLDMITQIPSDTPKHAVHSTNAQVFFNCASVQFSPDVMLDVLFFLFTG